MTVSRSPPHPDPGEHNRISELADPKGSALSRQLPQISTAAGGKHRHGRPCLAVDYRPCLAVSPFPTA